MKDFFGPDSPQPTDHRKWLPGGSSHRHILSQSWLIRTHPLVYSALTLIPLFLSVFVILHFLESRAVPMTRSFRLPIDSMSEKFADASFYSPLASAFRVALPPSIDILDDDIGVSTLPSCSELFFAKRKPSLGPSVTITGPALSFSGLPVVFIIGFDHGNERSRLLTMLALENLLKTTKLRSIAFEFSSDLQSSFNKYYASPKGAIDKQEFASSMIAHCPLSAYLDKRQKVECARRLLGTESIMSVLNVAELASRYKATVVLVDTPMATVSMTDPMISYRNQIIAKNVLRNVHGDKVLLIVGSAHTGHGDLGLSLDDRLMSLGARTLSVNVAAQKAPSRRDWGTNHASADFRISDPMELASLLARRYPGM